MINKMHIKIKKSNSTLEEVLKFVKQEDILWWSILWIKGIGHFKDHSMLELEEKINKSILPLQFNLKEIKEILTNMDDIYEITIIGDCNKDNLKKYDNDENMISSCNVVIEKIDSSFWELHVDESFVNNYIY